MPIAAGDVPSPFKFLDAYTKNDGDIFFGRDAEIEQLYQSVNKNRIVLVYGQSGTGKTSLVQCGLSNRFEVTDWVPFWIRRGKNINGSLHQALSQSKALGGAGVDQENLFRSLERLSKRYVRPIYLIFDQFEELLLLGDEAEKKQFLQTIQGILSNENTEACHLLFIIREEYFGWLESFETAIPGFSDRRLRVEPMRPDRLDEVIVQSCAAFNIQLEDPKENTRQIRESLRTKGGVALPYLQVYLDMLYREDYLRTYPDGWQGTGYPPMRFESREIYNMGAITDIMERLLNERREAIQRELSDRFPDLPADFVEDVLDSFVTFEGTKRPITCLRTVGGIQLGEKAPAPLRTLPNEPLSACLEALENNRLLRADEDTFELAHDSLAALIDRQRSEEQRRINEVYRQIRNSHQIYQETHTDFLSRNQLALYENYLPYLELDSELQEFLEKSRNNLRSVEEADREKLLEERRLRESAEKNEGQAKFRARLAIFLSVIALGAAVWAGTLLVQTRRAKDQIAAQVKASEAAALAAKSRKVFYDNHNVAWHLAARGYDLMPTPETALALRDMSYAILPAQELIGGHSQQVTSLQFSSDGLYRLSAGLDNTIRRSALDGSGSKLISLGYDKNSEVEFSADGRFAVAGMEDVVEIWDLENGRQVWQQTYTGKNVTRVALSPDGSKLAVGHSSDVVDIYDWRSRQLLSTFPLRSAITDLVFAPDGVSLATAERSDQPTLWSLDGTRKLTFRSGSAAVVETLAFSPDGAYLAGGEEYGNIRLWNANGEFNRTLEGEGAWITGLAFSPDSRQLLAGDYHGLLMRWYVEYRSRVNTILVEKGMPLKAVAFAPGGRQFFASDEQGNILAWPIVLEKIFLQGPPSEVSAVAYLDSTRFIAADKNGKLQLVDMQQGSKLLHQGSAQIWCVALSPDRKMVAAGTNVGDIYLVSTEEGGRVDSLHAGDSSISRIEFSPDGKQLLISNLQDGDARWISLSGETEHTYTAPAGREITTAILSPDGKMVFTPLLRDSAILWQLDGKILQEGFMYRAYSTARADYVPYEVSAALFTPDSRRLLTAGGDGMIKIWTLDGTEAQRFGQQGIPLVALALSPDGQYLATSSLANELNIWTLDGKLIQSFNLYAEAPNISFSADSRYILGASTNGIPILLPMWHTLLEKAAVSPVDLHRYGGMASDSAATFFLAADRQSDLAAYARYFAERYLLQGQAEDFDLASQLYEKALSPDFRAQADALSKAWWEVHLQVIPGDAPELVRLRELYERLRNQL